MSPAMPLIESGTFTTKPVEPGVWGIRFLHTATFVDKLIEAKRPALIGFEAPFMPPPPPTTKAKRAAFKGFRVNADTLRFLIGIVTVIEMVAARHGIPCREVNVQTVKASLAGGRKKEERARVKADLVREDVDPAVIAEEMKRLRRIDKGDMINAAHARGWDVKDEHQADACGVAKVLIENRIGIGAGNDTRQRRGAGDRLL